MSEKKLLGVLGGMGPIATAYFMELVIRMTDALRDQEHLDMLVYSVPSVPDRTGFILGASRESPLPEMIRVGRALANQGAERIAIPCVTAHYFYRELEESIPVPIINGLAQTVEHLKQRGVEQAGIMATDGTITAGLFRDAMLAWGIRPIVPSPERQKDVMRLIYDDIKANRPPRMEVFGRVREELLAMGAQTIVLGCTELSLIKRDYPVGAGFLDTMEVLAQRAVLECGGKLKEEYTDLISK